MTAAKRDASPVPQPDHGRTPENTPIPGGGAWTWDATAGAWVERLPRDAAPAAAKEP